MGGGKKYAEYIVKISFPDTERLDLEKNIFDLFIVDVASTFQCEGGLLRLFSLCSIISTSNSVFWISYLMIFQRYLR